MTANITPNQPFTLENDSIDATQQLDDLTPLGLGQNPFSDEDFPGVFLSPGRHDTAAKLFHLTQFGPAGIVVTGAEGIGKTTLKSQLVKEAHAAELITLTLQAGTMFSSERIIATIAQQLNLAVDNLTGTELFQIIRDEISTIHEEQQSCVVVIDDAHMLRQENLGMLKQLSYINGAHKLCLVLFGDDNLLERVTSEHGLNYSETDFHHIALKPLDQAETTQYIDARLALVDYTAIDFSSNEKAEIYKQSKGVPAMINLFGQESLFKSLSGKKMKKFSLPLLHVATISVIGVALIGLVYFEQTKSQPDGLNPALASNEIVREIPVQVSSSTQPLGITSDSFDGTGDIYANEENSGINNPTSAVAVTLSDTDSATPASVQATNDTDDTSSQTSSPIELAVIQNSLQQRGKAAQNRLLQSSAAAAKEVPEKEVPELVLSSIDVNKLAPPASITKRPKLRTETALQEQQAPIVDVDSMPQRTTEQSVTKATVTRAGIDQPRTVVTKITEKITTRRPYDDWLLGLNPQKFTLQLLGARSETAVQKFITDHKAVGDLAYYKSSLNGKPWFVVIQGGYDSKAQAKAAAVGLPATLRKQQPWARSIKDVQGSIKNTSA